MTGHYKRGIYHTNQGFVHVYALESKWLYKRVSLSCFTDVVEEMNQDTWDTCDEVNDLNILARFTRPADISDTFRICDGASTCLKNCSAKKVPNSATWISTAVLNNPSACIHSDHIDGEEHDCTYTTVYAKLKR
jgi:hypothetical protein